MLSVKLFGSGSAHRDEVADVAIVAMVGRRISVFLINALARARVGVVNARFGDARSQAIVITQLISLLESTAVKA